MHRAYKTKLRPTPSQVAYFSNCVNVARFVYNWTLADRKRCYEQGLKTNKFEQKKRFNALKSTAFPWLAEYPQVIGERAFDNLDETFRRFFQRVKDGHEKPGYPRFKNRHTSRKSFCLVERWSHFGRYCSGCFRPKYNTRFRQKCSSAHTLCSPSKAMRTLLRKHGYVYPQHN